MKIYVNIMEYQYIYPIEKEYIGLIMGKDYKTINYLRIENKVKMKLLPKKDKYKSRAFIIKGSHIDVTNVCIIITKIISKVKNSNKLFFYDNEPLSTKFTWDL
jgi:hypothetical protein